MTASCLILGGWITIRAQAVSSQSDNKPSASTTDPVRTVLAGVFTEVQARRGEQMFQQNCSSCHAPGQFSGEIFQQLWTDRPVGELYEVMSTSMPENAPGSLSPSQYTDILAFFLLKNDYPHGADELAADRRVLNQLVFKPAR
jgi:S-disulfanyl-L-cysteine oxidoreductase SoxD